MDGIDTHAMYKLTDWTRVDQELHDQLFARLVECERLGLRLKRIRVTAEQWRLIWACWFWNKPDPKPGENYRFCGYSIIVNSEAR